MPLGTLLAAETLLKTVSSSLTSGYMANSMQLPASAQADFQDARRPLDEARIVLAMTEQPNPLRQAATLLASARDAFTNARDRAASNSGRSQPSARIGRERLAQAAAFLDHRSETALGPTTAARRRALALAYADTQPRAPRHVRHAAHKHKVLVRHPIPLPTATPQPTFTSTPLPTATPRPRVVRVHTHPHHARRLHIRKRLRPTATHRPTVTATPDPTSTPAPSATPVPTKGPAVLVAASTKRSIEGARDLTQAVTARIARCQVDLAQLATGTDPMGSVKLERCADRAQREVARVQRGIGDLRGQPKRLALPLESATKQTESIVQSLQKERTDVGQADMERAKVDLTEAAAATRTLTRELNDAHTLISLP